MFQLKRCCCVCSLHTGSKVASWYGLISGLVAGIVYIILMVHARTETVKDENNHHVLIVDGKYPLWSINVIVSLARAVSSIFLLYGVYKENPEFYLPWIAYNAFAVAGDYVFIIVFVLYEDSFLAIINFVLTSIYVYFLLVVFSDYRELQNMLHT